MNGLPPAPSPEWIALADRQGAWATVAMIILSVFCIVIASVGSYVALEMRRNRIAQDAREAADREERERRHQETRSDSQMFQQQLIGINEKTLANEQKGFEIDQQSIGTIQMVAENQKALAEEHRQTREFMRTNADAKGTILNNMSDELKQVHKKVENISAGVDELRGQRGA